MGGSPSYSIGPGLGGFLAFFFLALALWLLMRNMSGRLRRISYEQRLEEAQARPEREGHGRPEGAERGADEPVETPVETPAGGAGAPSEPADEARGGTAHS